MGTELDTLRFGLPTLSSGHMNPFLVGDEIMNPCISNANELRITELTSHILADLGTVLPNNTFVPFYTVDHTKADRMWYGYMRGCNFEPDICSSSVAYPYDSVECKDLCLDNLYLIPTSLEGAIALSDQSVVLSWVSGGNNDGMLLAAPSSSHSYYPGVLWVILVMVLVCIGLLISINNVGGDDCCPYYYCPYYYYPGNYQQV